MGCGSSSLKGETPEDIAPQPIKQVKTNFSTVDYDSGAQGRRDTVYAPHETKRAKSDALSPLQEKTDPIQGSIDSTAVGSSQPQTVGNDRIDFDNKVPGHSDSGIQTTHDEDPANKAPYQDVTASPTTPFQTRTIEEQLPPTHTKETTEPIEQSSIKPSTQH